MDDKIKFEFNSKMWKYPAPGGWHFVSLPKYVSSEIRENLQWQEEGWGRMKATAEIDHHKWETAIWFDSKIETYVLPIKAAIRTKANVQIDQNVKVNIWL